MRFLHINECAEWCREQGATVADPWHLTADPTLSTSTRIVFAPDGSLGLEPQVAEACITTLGHWRECLLWVTAWGIWPSTENWPAFYALRAQAGEPTGLDYKPGHLFLPPAAALLQKYLQQVLQNGWDAHLLPSANGHISRRFSLSHDGWVSLATARRHRSP
jgi:hypothetical protein